MASTLQWIPESLYNSAVSAVVVIYSKTKPEIRTLPENVQFDIYYELYKQGRLCQLGVELCDLDTFARVLKVNDKRLYLHHAFQALMDHGVLISEVLADSFTQRSCLVSNEDVKTRQAAIQLGASLGAFLSEAGWFLDAENVFIQCLQLSKINLAYDCHIPCHWQSVLECYSRLLHVCNAYSKFAEAQHFYEKANCLVEELIEAGHSPSLAALFAEFSSLFFVKSEYDMAYSWSLKALEQISPSLSIKVIVDVLRQAAKACVVKRDFKKAELVIKQAVCLAREHFGQHHFKYSDVLLDYGFYLLNIDLTVASVQVYQAALDIRKAVFGGNNSNVATAHEDLAYASYVFEYSSGKFGDAHDHAEKALQIMMQILPKDHLMLASSKRIKALILEEIAIDNQDKRVGASLLCDAEDLHLSALQLSQNAFGEMNIQTAKHYGNLGRLYQSMKRFKEAEKMHLKAIEIKEALLGPHDYEIALTAGHLASLYNYDMERYTDAEKLYLRSISIAKKHFGDAYSGLEYDYRGLLRVYNLLGDIEKAIEYKNILIEWKVIRDMNAEHEESPLNLEQQNLSTSDVIQIFMQTL